MRPPCARSVLSALVMCALGAPAVAVLGASDALDALDGCGVQAGRGARLGRVLLQGRRW